jgi:Rieske Fe-S protein
MSGLTTADLPVNAVAYESAHQLFLCHDAAGFFCMSSKCTHAATDLGPLSGQWNPSDLAGGFHCPTHGSNFDGNGVPLAGSPAGSPLPHYHLAIDGSQNLWIDTAMIAGIDCRCPG